MLFISAVPLAMYLAFGDRHGPAPRDEHTVALPRAAARVKPAASASARSDVAKRASAFSQN
jgi:hypothetical protein